MERLNSHGTRIYTALRTAAMEKSVFPLANQEETEKLCNTSDEVLEYMVGADRLRDVITQVTVLDRTI